MEEKKNFEAIFKEDLYQYLLGIDKVDAHLPEAPRLLYIQRVIKVNEMNIKVLDIGF